MKRNNSIKKNYIMNSILSIANILFPLLTFPYVSRILLPEGTGKVAFANSIVAYFLMFAQLGVPMYAVRACAQVRDSKKELSKTTKELLAISIFMTLVSCLVFAIGVMIVPKLYAERTMYLVLSVSLLLQSIGMEWLFKAVEEYSYITKRSLILKTISICATFLLIHKPSDYIIYAGISVCASSASYVLNFIYSSKFVDLKLPQKLEIKKHIKSILVFFALNCATTIYVNLDLVMIGFLHGDGEVGIYNTAIKLRTLLLTLVTSLGTVILPRAASYIGSERMAEFEKLIKKSLSFVFIIAIPLVIYFILFAKPCILLLAGDNYYNSILPMQILMVTLFFVGISNVTGIQMLVPLKKEKIVLCSTIVGAIVDLILNYFFIIKYGAVGAAFATLIAEICVLGVQLFALRDKLERLFEGIACFEYFVVSIVSAISSLWVYRLNINYFATLVISAILFFGVFYFVLYMRKQPIIYEIVMLAKGVIRKMFRRSNRI